MTLDIDQLKQLVEDSNQEQAVREACCAELAKIFANLDLPWLAWSEETYSAQPKYPGLNRAQIALRWLKLAYDKRLIAHNDMARGLTVTEQQ